jgi:hypothetical protein
VMFLFFLARTQQISCGEITVLTSTKKKVRRVLARKSLPRTNQNSPSAFSHQIRNNSKKDKTKTSQMMGWIENKPNKFLNQNFVCQGLPDKSKIVRFRFISLMCSTLMCMQLWMGMEPQPLNNGMVCSPAVTQAFSRLSKSGSTRAMVTGCRWFHMPVHCI